MNTRSTLAFSPGAAGPFLKEAGRLERPPHWTEFALCAEVDPEIFFPDLNRVAWDAKSVCAACDVKRSCLLASLDGSNPDGIWGGLSKIERRHLGPDPSPEAITEALSHVGMKACGGCGGEKPISQFPRRSADGLYAHACKDCMNRAARERRAAA